MATSCDSVGNLPAPSATTTRGALPGTIMTLLVRDLAITDAEHKPNGSRGFCSVPGTGNMSLSGFLFHRLIWAAWGGEKRLQGILSISGRVL